MFGTFCKCTKNDHNLQKYINADVFGILNNIFTEQETPGKWPTNEGVAEMIAKNKTKNVDIVAAFSVNLHL